jgi:hypothetical protein
VYCVIVSEFGKRQDCNPIVRLVVVESLEILLQHLILKLCLPVYLSMEGCRELMVTTQVRTFPGPESACKVGAAICYYVCRDATPADDVFKEEPGPFW